MTRFTQEQRWDHARDLRKHDATTDIRIVRNGFDESAMVTACTERAGHWLCGYFLGVVDNVVRVASDAIPEIETAARAEGLTTEVR